MVGFNSTFTSSDKKNEHNSKSKKKNDNNSANNNTFFHQEKKKEEKPKFLSDEDLCRRVSNLPDRVLISGFDKPLEQELAALPTWQKLALRAWWFNPDAWAELARETKLEFIRYLLDNNSSQHQIAEQLRGTVLEVCKTLCGYNAVKGVCTKTFGRHNSDDSEDNSHHKNDKADSSSKNSTNSNNSKKNSTASKK